MLVKCWFGEKSTCRRSSESNDSYSLLSGGYCGEDEFISEEAVSKLKVLFCTLKGGG